MSDRKRVHLTGSAIWRKEEVGEDRNALWVEDQRHFQGEMSAARLLKNVVVSTVYSW